jgi:hypothetical protein
VEILHQFLMRLAFGLAVGMSVLSPRQVTSGYFRNHLYVTLGLGVLASLVAWSLPVVWTWPALTVAVASYIGSVLWLYERPTWGRLLLGLVAIMGWIGATQSAVGANLATATFPQIMAGVGATTSGLLLGLTLAAMLLGHWYLNSPSMQLTPLRKLIRLASLAVIVQACVSGLGIIMAVTGGPTHPISWYLFLVLRWGFGILGVLLLLRLASKTLDIPNTQSATGILYVGVIGVFVGELCGLLLSAEAQVPL